MLRGAEKPVLLSQPPACSKTRPITASEMRAEREPAFYQELARAAVLAPSPDNNQPWRFSVREGKLLIHPDHERALPSDVGSMFMMLALGAAAENACIAARQLGYEAKSRCLDGDASGAATVELSFTAGAEPDPLYEQLERRRTCRRMYSRRPIDRACIMAMSSTAESFDGVRMHWITERSKLRRLGWLIAASDRIRLEHRSFHEELYKQLRFTPEQTERTRDGLDVRTLELPPGGAFVLQWLRHWNRMQIGNRLGLSRLLSLPSAAACWCSGAVGLMTVTERSVPHYLLGGRALQRLWLVAQSLGLSIQPMGSLPIYLNHLETGSKTLSPAHQRRIKRIAQQLHSLAAPAEPRIIMLVRLGYSAPPDHRALRKAGCIDIA